VGGSQVAQAVEFMRALHVHLRKMNSDLARVEREGVADKSSREMRVEAAALRRDISEAKLLIERLHRRYLNANESNGQS
jgi:hypothetical protein